MKLVKLIGVLWCLNNAVLSAICPAVVIELTDLICCKMSWCSVDGFSIISHWSSGCTSQDVFYPFFASKTRFFVVVFDTFAAVTVLQQQVAIMSTLGVIRFSFKLQSSCISIYHNIAQIGIQKINQLYRSSNFETNSHFSIIFELFQTAKKILFLHHTRHTSWFTAAACVFVGLGLFGHFVWSFWSL